LFKKVLVPLDGSAYAESILEHVRMMASSCGSPEVILLTVIEPYSPESYIVPENILEEAHKKAMAQARKRLKELATDLSREGISANVEVLDGNPAEAILEYARENAVNLIVLSTHGRTGMTRWALGSNTDRVIRRSPIPILVVSPPGIRAAENA
jgi:nucleotide-binding universal stress UspA family protein